MLIIELFIDFLCWDTDVRRIEEITRGIANSAFRTHGHDLLYLGGEVRRLTCTAPQAVTCHGS
jgi:hypothetical protein